MKIVWFAVGCLATSCAASPDVPAKDVATVAIAQSLAEAQRTSANPSEFAVQTRYNPARCDCPSFEVFVYGAWKRVWITGNEGTLKMLDDFGRQPRSTAATLEIRGRLLQSSKMSQDNVRFLLFEAE